MYVLMLLTLCCISNRGLLCGSVSNDKIKVDIRVGGHWNIPNSSSMWKGEPYQDG